MRVIFDPSSEGDLILPVQAFLCHSTDGQKHCPSKVTKNTAAIICIPVQAFCDGYTRGSGKDNSQLHQKRHSARMLLTCHSVCLTHCLQAWPPGCHLIRPVVLRLGLLSEQACMSMPQGRPLCNWCIEIGRTLYSHTHVTGVHSSLSSPCQTYSSQLHSHDASGLQWECSVLME